MTFLYALWAAGLIGLALWVAFVDFRDWLRQ